MCFIQIMKLCDWIPSNINSIYNFFSHLFPSLHPPAASSQWRGWSCHAPPRRPSCPPLALGQWSVPSKASPGKMAGSKPMQCHGFHSKMLGNMDVRSL